MPDLSMSEGYDDLTEDERLNKQMDLEKEFSEKGEKLQNISQLLKAYSLFEKDINYVLNEGKVMIVDEFTGRILPGRRYSDGLHQAIEAKEGVRIEGETQTLAAKTYQQPCRKKWLTTWPHMQGGLPKIRVETANGWKRQSGKVFQ